MSRWTTLATLVALFGAWCAPPVSASPQKVEEVKKKDTKQQAGKQAGKKAGKKVEKAEEAGHEEGQEAGHEEGQEAGADQVSPAVGIFGEADEDAAAPVRAPGTDVALLRLVANEEGRFRKRNAQIKRARAVATEKGDEKALERIAALEGKNTAHHEKRMTELRDKYGADNVDASLVRIEKVGKGLREGKGAAKGEEMRQKAKEKNQELKEQDKAKAKDQIEKAKQKNKDKVKEGEGN